MNEAFSLIDRLRTLLGSGAYPEQSRMPPERKLAATFGVTRAALRNALEVLEKDGRIWRHVGRGTFVGRMPDSARPVTMPSDLTDPAEIMEARLALEPRLCALAAERATSQEMDYMRQCLDSSAQAANIHDYERWDAKLHRAIAESGRNPVLLALFQALHAMREHRMWEQVKQAMTSQENQSLLLRQHRALVDAIIARDPRAAEAAMRVHLETVHTHSRMAKAA